MTQDVAGLCWQPYVKGFVLDHNSLYNNWRFDDVRLDKYPCLSIGAGSSPLIQVVDIERVDGRISDRG